MTDFFTRPDDDEETFPRKPFFKSIAGTALILAGLVVLVILLVAWA